MVWPIQHFDTVAAAGPVEGYQERLDTAAEKRHKRIAEAAYYIAEKRGFQGEMMLDDWLQAEAKEDSRFRTRDWSG